MLPGVDNLPRPVSTTEALSAAGSIGGIKQDVVSKLDQLVIGKQVQGEALSRLNDGTFFVKIAGVTARMALPDDTKPGDKLALTLLALNPLPTFLLGSGDNAITTTASFSRQDLIGKMLQDVGQQNSISTSSKLPVTAEDTAKAALGLLEQYTSTPTNLSTAGKLINSILQAAQQQNLQQGTALTLVGKTALAQDPSTFASPEKLAANLQQAISSSGLFYESHVADWAQGKMSLSELMREPQAQQATQQTSQTTDVNTLMNKLADNSSLAQIIHLQLDTLEQQKITWQGNLLPGMPMEWEIVKDDSQQTSGQAEAVPSWQSAMRFELPSLGAISAKISLQGNHLQFYLRASNPESATLLQSHVSTLADSIELTGSQLDSFSIKHDDNA